VRRVFALNALVALALAASATPATASPDSALRTSLSRSIASAGAASGAMVVDLASGRTLFSRRPDAYRVPASNQKLFTSSVALLRFGPNARLTTRVLGTGSQGADGTYTGDLYLRGGGDPTFGSPSFVRRVWGTGASVTDLADQLVAEGILRVRGAVVGDESYFDRRRGGPASGYAFDPYVGAPLSALAFNRGLANERGSAIQARPATFAADQLRRALVAEGIPVTGRAREGLTPDGARELASVTSPTISTLIRLTNVPSDNYLAEMLLKDLGARFAGAGSTAAGAGVVRSRLAPLGVYPRVVDGSGLSRFDRTTPRQVVRVLRYMAFSTTAGLAFRGSLAVACRSGTLASRMCGTPAAGRCQGKTGTLGGVSALSGYCSPPGGGTVVFSFLMNGVNVTGARRLQNTMAAAIARYRPTPVQAPPVGAQPARAGSG
jgi:D-alanyl-D-alanine carboxypeptidase/D-alanyl-D-alanine-endopeptidase (penicillin-binding protein 4)